MDIRATGKLLTEDTDLSTNGNNRTPSFFACTSKDPCQTKATSSERIVHKKWKSLHLDCVMRNDDIREFDDTYTSESEEEHDNWNQTGSQFGSQRINLATDNTKVESMSVNDLSSTMCTDINNLQSTEALSENDISHIISEVPSVDRSELGSSMSELIRQFEFTDDKTTLTCVSSLQELNSHTKLSGYSDIFTTGLYTPKKSVLGLNQVEKSLYSFADTTVFSSPETSEYSVYTIIHEEDLSHDATCKLMDANTANRSRQSNYPIQSSPCRPTFSVMQPKSTKLQQSHFEGLVNSSVHHNYAPSIRTVKSGNTKSSDTYDGFQKLSKQSHISQEKDISSCNLSVSQEKVTMQSCNPSLKHTRTLQQNPKKLHPNHTSHTIIHRPSINNVNNHHMTAKPQDPCILYQNKEELLYHKRHMQYVPQKTIANSSNNHHVGLFQGNTQPSSCKSKSLGDLTSEDISCNFESKYKRINKGFLSSGIVDEKSISRPQSTDTLTEQLRKLMSFDQEDNSMPQCCEDEEVDTPKPLARKLSSRSQSRVRNIANRAKERQEANKLKHSTPNLHEVILRNKPTTASQPLNRHSTGSYIASYYNNLNGERLEGRGMPEGSCNSQIYRYDTFCTDQFDYQTEPSNTDEPEIYFLLRL